MNVVAWHGSLRGLFLQVIVIGKHIGVDVPGSIYVEVRLIVLHSDFSLNDGNEIFHYSKNFIVIS